MQELSAEKKRFQQIKAKEKKIAIEKTNLRLANPTFSKQQIDETYERQRKVKNVVVKNNYGEKHIVVVQKV